MIEERRASRLIRLLPAALASTFLVAACPLLVVSKLHPGGIIPSILLSAALGVLVSLAIAHVARMYWEKRESSRDVLFSELMIWGWARRWVLERRLANAVALLGLRGEVVIRGGLLPLSASRRTRALERLATDLEARDPYTHGHSRRVARLSCMIARRMGLSRAEIVRIRTAAALHDIGKIRTPLSILHKPGRLTDEEFDVIKRHPGDGAKMVSVLDDAELAAIIRHHHERLDGSGYPDGLIGDRVPLGASIIAVADAFDAITSERPYRGAKPHRTAIEILDREAGTELDAQVVRAFHGVYAGSRPLGAWAAITSSAERVVSSLFGGAVGAGSQAIAIVGATAALGAAMIALPASAQRGGAKAPPKATGSGQAGVLTAARLEIATLPCCQRASSVSGTRGARSGASSTGASRMVGAPGSGPSGKGPVTRTGGGTSGGGTSGGGTGGGGTSGGGTGGGTGGGGGSPSGPVVTTHVGGGGASVGVQPAPTVGIHVGVTTQGSTGATVGATVGGTGVTVKVHLG